MEATESFFAMTKLFQSNDVSLLVVFCCICLVGQAVNSVFFSLEMCVFIQSAFPTCLELPDLGGKGRMRKRCFVNQYGACTCFTHGHWGSLKVSGSS